MDSRPERVVCTIVRVNLGRREAWAECASGDERLKARLGVVYVDFKYRHDSVADREIRCGVHIYGTLRRGGKGRVELRDFILVPERGTGAELFVHPPSSDVSPARAARTA